MAFNDLLSTSFLFSVAIIIILIGAIFAYVSYRMSEQDHKISSMLGLVSTMAEELQFFRSKLINSNSKSSTGQNEEEQEQEHVRLHTMLDPNNLVTGITEQTKLISVSDDEDEVSDEDDMDEDDDEEDTDEEETDEEEADTDADADAEEVSDDEDQHEDAVVDLEDVVDLTDTDLTDMKENQNIKSIHLEEPIDLKYVNEDFTNLDIDIDHLDETLTTDLQPSVKDLEEPNKKPDYKKMSLTKLREIVVEKGIFTDASKLKKGDLLKLLGDE